MNRISNEKEIEDNAYKKDSEKRNINLKLVSSMSLALVVVRISVEIIGLK